ncbi:MAG: hypothetical protein IJM21_04970 [Clostridia bacterium]|nr:hypothetical protein [Clostridia bacterium]
MAMIEIGSRKECLFDAALLDPSQTGASFRLHSPEYRGPVMVHDAPWEGNGCDYHNFFFDPDWKGVHGDCPSGTFRMYYLGWWMPNGDPSCTPGTGIHVCYAESADGLSWEKPSLGLAVFKGSRENNMLFGPEEPNSFDNFMVFRDTRPGCPEDERYKAVASWNGGEAGRKNVLRAYYSADGLSFRLGPVLTEDGFFDSLNVCFYDEEAGLYRLYFRGFHLIPGDDLNAGVRDIRTMESPDFVHWTEPALLDFRGGPDYALYTNCVQPCPGAPHLLLGFPTRYVERPSWTKTFDELTGAEARKKRMTLHPRYGLTVTDCVFMVSRDGRSFTRYEDAFIRPGPENGLNWIYGDAYPARGFFTSPSPVPGAPDELSILLFGHHWSNGPAVLERYGIRQDGFVSVHGPMEGARMTTLPFTYTGDELIVNFSTSARGGITFRLITEEGDFVSEETFGDALERRVRFPDDGTVARLSGKPLRLEAELRDADLYSIRFQ